MSLSAAFLPFLCCVLAPQRRRSFTTAKVAPYEYKHEAAVQLLIGAWRRALRGVGGSPCKKKKKALAPHFLNHLRNCRECGGPRCKAARRVCERPSVDDGVSPPMSVPPQVVFFWEEITALRSGSCHDRMQTESRDRRSTACFFGGGSPKCATRGRLAKIKTK